MFCKITTIAAALSKVDLKVRKFKLASVGQLGQHARTAYKSIHTSCPSTIIILSVILFMSYLTSCVWLANEPIWNTFRNVCWKSNAHTDKHNWCRTILTSTKIPVTFSFGCSLNAIWSSSWRWTVLNLSCGCSRNVMRPLKDIVWSVNMIQA